ncbi:MAG: hypothetical protein HYV07_16375 [Deltaproteobacteria bacterium]|nr:hypothetical protein [Deltaproteobacteria bacterium]
MSRTALLMTSLSISLAASSATAQTPEGPSLTAKLPAVGQPRWLGPKPHFKVSGRIANEDIDYDLDASNIGRFWCEREYNVPRGADGTFDYKKGRLHEIKIEALLDRSHEHFRVELELKRHDFQSDKPGTKVKVVPRYDPSDPKPNEMWLEWEWHAADAMTAGTWENFEAAATVGTFQLNAFTGKPDSSGLVIPEKEGVVGGAFEAIYSPTERLSVSFTVKCRVNRVAPGYL